MTPAGLPSRVLRGWHGLQDWAAFGLMLAVTFLVFVQVILRYVLHHPLMGIEELLLFPTIWLYFLGGAIASRERNHIECRVLTMYVRGTSLHLANALKTAISLGVAVWLTYWAYEYFRYALRVGKESDMLYIPLVLGESALFIGLLLMSAYTAHELLDHLRAAAGSRRRSVAP
jgi:TRAP-type C4-dicarboxylate transport system permease small subunit